MPSNEQPNIEVGRLTFRVTWPEIYNRETGNQWEVFLETVSSLEEQIRGTVCEHFGGVLEVTGLYYRRGTIELLVLLGGAYATVKDYKDLRDGLRLLVKDLTSVIKRFFQTTMPQALQGTNAYDVEGHLRIDPGLQSTDTKIVRGDQSLPSGSFGPLTWLPWYLVISNAVLITMLIFLVLRLLSAV